MLNKIRNLFIKNQGLEFSSTDIGWFTPKQDKLDSSNAFDWASEQSEEDRGAAYFLAQLVNEGQASLDASGLIIPWANVYSILNNDEYEGLTSTLQLPAPSSKLQPILDCNNTLSDSDFSLNISGWRQGNNLIKQANLVGATLNWENENSLISESAWKLLNIVQDFNKRPDDEKNQGSNELAWGRIRAIASSANAVYNSRYLETTIIITPETLQLNLDRSMESGVPATVVSPVFTDAPEGWLERFDSLSKVQDSYNFASTLGLCKVILSEPVKQVLGVIKRDMPQRQVVGRTAEAFIRNPYALLGEEAFKVIDEESFDKEREKLGDLESSWKLHAVINNAQVDRIDIHISTDGYDTTKHLHHKSELEEFLTGLETSISKQSISHHWQGYQLSLDGNTGREIEQGERILAIWIATEKLEIDIGEIYDLSGYSDRVIGIGELRPVGLPILLKDDEKSSWSPEMEPAILVQLPDTDAPTLIPATQEFREELGKNIGEAKAIAADNVELPTLHFAVPLPKAEHALNVISEFLSNGASGASEPKPPKEKPPKPPTLIIGTNFNQEDYIKERARWLETSGDFELKLPISLRSNISLKEHQSSGVARLQYLASVGSGCFGALLADDMGLGKTLQLLCLIGEFYEKSPNAAPSIIVAPVTLLENWEQEVAKFFDPSFPQLLRLHGNNLTALKQPKDLIASQLLEEGITKLLKPDWLGDAKLVITTYETLRDHEFSLARQDFEFFICDEAQKIKNPSARATLAIKKQKARFRIACTGTPVENNLVDLWSLFDWIQPGLLGTVQEFHKLYRRPIEAETEDEVASLEILKSLIKPQTLRRTKEDISADLPKKIEITGVGQEIIMSAYQHQHYQDCITRLGAAQDDQDAKKRVKDTWSLLHKIKAICAEPYCLPGMLFQPDTSLSRHLINSPKINWLLEELAKIKDQNEKVIIFTELRQVQQALHFFIKKEFGISPEIVNGLTKNRQRYIDRFHRMEGFNTIILSPLAAGAGLNIVGANHVIHFTRTWNPAKEAQATDRVYRIGQTKDVFVHCPTIISDKDDDLVTFEEKLNLLMLSKQKLARDMLNGGGSSFTPGEFVKTDDKNETPIHLQIADIERLDGVSFEWLSLLLFKKEGWPVETTPISGDGGVDLIAIDGCRGLLIQCKSSTSQNSRLGWEAVKDVTAGRAMYEKRYPMVTFKKIAITNQYFNETAIDQAVANNVELFNKDDIALKLKIHPILRNELDDLL